jgi:hypothetical protein
MSIIGYRLGEGWVGHMDRVTPPQKMLGTGVISKTPPYRVFPAANAPKDLRRHTVSLLRLRPASILRSLQSRPHGDRNSQGCRLLASAIPWCCFPAVRRQLQHPRPTADPSVPFLANFFVST